MMALFSVPSIEAFAIPGVSLLIAFLAYSSQFLFHHIEPSPLSSNQAIWFNSFVLGIWWCYYNACTVNPGPKGWVDKLETKGDSQDESEDSTLQKGLRWCRKCSAIKPPRAHHCRQCGRYVFHIACQNLCYANITDVSRRWITIVRGRPTACRIPLSLIFYDSSSMRLLVW